MWKWGPSDVLAEDEWTVNHQIVVLSVHRPEILYLAYGTPMSGNLGVKRPTTRVLKFLFTKITIWCF